MNTPLTIKETQKGLVNGDFSAGDLVKAYYHKIKKNDGKLNSFLTLAEKFAYKKAELVDLLLKKDKKDIFKEYPLLGVSVAHKDLFSTKGIRTTAASRVLENYIPAYNASVVSKINKAGGKLLLFSFLHAPHPSLLLCRWVPAARRCQ